jgi:hypothetical protein
MVRGPEYSVKIAVPKCRAGLQNGLDLPVLPKKYSDPVAGSQSSSLT